MFRASQDSPPIYFEKFNDSELNIKNIRHILAKYRVVTFNGNHYDRLILEGAMMGFSNAALKQINDDIIPPKDNNGKVILDKKGEPIKGLINWKVRKKYGFREWKFNHVDLKEVAPGAASLKMYAGRIHCREMQDLPIDPDELIKESDLKGMRKYCGVDCNDTLDLLGELTEQIDLRAQMSKQYGVDLRSKSDAQIAESVYDVELRRRFDIAIKKPKYDPKATFRYTPPKYLKFDDPLFNHIFKIYAEGEFSLGGDGKLKAPKELLTSKYLKAQCFTYDGMKYKVGVGGIHSIEKKVSHVAGDNIIKEYDVNTFYPRIIIRNRYYPKHIGEKFLEVYEPIIAAKGDAKRKGQKKREATIKIIINGTFGKFGSAFAKIFAPELMMHVTVTGQLSLLMLIERFSVAGIQVISANTDGIYVKCRKEKEHLADLLVEQWEEETGYEMEGIHYQGVYSRDVNNYIAFTGDKVKAKGIFKKPDLDKNVETRVCYEAVIDRIENGTPIETYIRDCDDVRKFLSTRKVNGGALYFDDYLGKAVRWYYSKYSIDCITYKTNGNKVAKSHGCVPAMKLPTCLPDDLDYDWYINTANKLLKDIGFV